jgi:transposase
MGKTLSSRAKDWREGRRLRAWELKEKGWSQREIANALGVTEGAVSQWMERGRQGGVGGLRKRTPPGVSPRLNEGQKAELAELISNYDAEDYGFTGEVWTTRRISWLIGEKFGVSYHVGPCKPAFAQPWVLSPEAYSPSQSARRGGHRALEERALARAEKTALAAGRTILFADQSGFYLLPGVVRTYAPVGQTPVLDEQATRDHLSVMSAITLGESC